MTWTTKALDRVRDYVVIQHRLRDINGEIAGIKFRHGYAVVEKGCKAYLKLKSLPMLKGTQEFPLLHLRKLKFITRTLDVKLIFGQDVYYQYLEQLNKALAEEAETAKEQAEHEHIFEKKSCAYRTKSGELCKHNAYERSLSGYCVKHIILDEHLESFGIKVPSRLTIKEKGEWRDKILYKLESLPKSRFRK